LFNHLRQRIDKKQNHPGNRVRRAAIDTGRIVCILYADTSFPSIRDDSRIVLFILPVIKQRHPAHFAPTARIPEQESGILAKRKELRRGAAGLRQEKFFEAASRIIHPQQKRRRRRRGRLLMLSNYYQECLNHDP
jgi:hypothetical protein